MQDGLEEEVQVRVPESRRRSTETDTGTTVESRKGSISMGCQAKETDTGIRFQGKEVHVKGTVAKEWKYKYSARSKIREYRYNTRTKARKYLNENES